LATTAGAAAAAGGLGLTGVGAGCLPLEVAPADVGLASGCASTGGADVSASVLAGVGAATAGLGLAGADAGAPGAPAASAASAAGPLVASDGSTAAVVVAAADGGFGLAGVGGGAFFWVGSATGSGARGCFAFGAGAGGLPGLGALGATVGAAVPVVGCSFSRSAELRVAAPSSKDSVAAVGVATVTESPSPELLSATSLGDA
jgi:hypothetical protein